SIKSHRCAPTRVENVPGGSHISTDSAAAPAGGAPDDAVMPPARRRQRHGVFVDLGIGMMAFGVLIGAVFPFFARFLGVPSPYAFNLRFWCACLAAGVLLGAANWVLARKVIGQRLRFL